MKFTILYSVLALIIVSSCGEKPNTKADSIQNTTSLQLNLSEDQVKNAGIIASKLEQKTLTSVIKLNGIIDVPPQNLISICAPMGGFLKQTTLLPGQFVSKGETLAIMEDVQYIQLQQDYLTAGARLNMLKSEYERQKELNKTKAGSDKILEQTTAEYSSQRIARKAMYEKLRLIGINPDALNENNISRTIRIPSPINGYVSTVKINTGKYINPTDVMFELVDPSDIHLNVKVYEKDLDKLSIGQTLVAWTNSDPTIKYPLSIKLIGKLLGPDRTVDVHCYFKNYDKKLIPGLYMQSELEIKSQSATSVPDDAIFHADNKDYCFVMIDKTQFMLTEITKGISQGGYTAISKTGNQLFKDELIVTKGGYMLWMEMKNKTE